MNSKKLAVIFPGIGYHKDKPLLYYASKLAMAHGYDLFFLEYSDLPQGIMNDSAKKREAFALAYAQVEKRMSSVNLSDYNHVIFIGKSIGTILAAKYAANQHFNNSKQLWYTPLEETFSFGIANALAFIGDADPWSDVDDVKSIAAEQGIDLLSYPDCNHSLECKDVNENIRILGDVMQRSEEYLK